MGTSIRASMAEAAPRAAQKESMERISDREAANPIYSPKRSTRMKALAMLFSLALAALAQTIPSDPNDIAGTVTSSKGPEAGVWVIAETTALPTKFAKIVVTDDRGRYLLPDLPKATYSIWVRGYGLV